MQPFSAPQFSILLRDNKKREKLWTIRRLIQFSMSPLPLSYTSIARIQQHNPSQAVDTVRIFSGTKSRSLINLCRHKWKMDCLFHRSTEKVFQNIKYLSRIFFISAGGMLSLSNVFKFSRNLKSLNIFNDGPQ